MPVGALVNVRMGDFNPAAGTLKVSLKKGRAPSRIKLSRPAQASLKRYLAAIRPYVTATDPMFGSVVARSVNVKKAVCTSELKRVLASRAKAAKLSTKLIYTK
jgi:site-specific recombinase XerD